MNLYIPPFYPLAGGNNGIPEVSPTVIILSSRVDYPYWLTTYCGQLSFAHQPLPHFHHHLLGDITWQPSPLI
jgi:hypothetical protein